jgi:hypothetical protein
MILKNISIIYNADKKDWIMKCDIYNSNDTKIGDFGLDGISFNEQWDLMSQDFQFKYVNDMMVTLSQKIIDGNDSNTGLGPATNQAWQTLSKALGASGISSGDTLYVAPGDYRINTTLTCGKIYTSFVNIIGDTTASQFTGIVPGRVLLTNRSTNDIGSSLGSFNLIAPSSNYVSFSNFMFEVCTANIIFVFAPPYHDVVFNNCHFIQSASSGSQSNPAFVDFVSESGNVDRNITFNKCMFTGRGLAYVMYQTIGTSVPYFANYKFYNCYCQAGFYFSGGSRYNYSSYGIEMVNCYINGSVLFFGHKDPIYLTNSYVTGQWGGYDGGSPPRYPIARNSIVGSFSGGYTAINCYVSPLDSYDYGMYRRWGLGNRTFLSAYDNSFAAIGGTSSSGAGVTGGMGTTTDYFGNSWTTPNPQIGVWNNYSTTIIGQYNPTEKLNTSSTYTPNETSKSLNIYLGSTGLSHTTPNLAAFYIRQNSAPVSISLQSQTPTGSWVSGGFAEIDSLNQPGLYRLDIPNAAFASGVQTVSVFVKGTSTTNGAYVNCQALDIPGTIFNTQAGIYTASGTLGARLLQTVSDNRPVIVTSANQIQVDAGQTFSSGSGTTILDPILNSVGRWTLEGSTLTLYNSDGTYLRRCNLTQLGLSLSPT